MSKYLCKVDRVYQLPGRLVIVADTLYDDFDKGWRHGVTVELKRPDGTSLQTQTWMETGSPTNIGRPMAFSVEKTLTKADIPIGSEVWLVQEQQSQPEQFEKPEQRHSA
jgi:hypothetical protein